MDRHDLIAMEFPRASQLQDTRSSPFFAFFLSICGVALPVCTSCRIGYGKSPMDLDISC
ncbi:hypothetical protein BDZ91DRAFT_744267 [Kalaharituber pfeilii]|nr:hypothetical protein BDZ91DRAFT_744267 [Kalaharituber pfeilii]